MTITLLNNTDMIDLTKLTGNQKFAVDSVNAQMSYDKILIDEFLQVKDKVLTLISKWDGKIYNKRFLTALQELSPNLHVYYTDYTFEIYLSNYNNRTFESAYSTCTTYVTNEKIYLFHTCPDWRNNNKYIFESDKVIESINKNIESKLQEIDKVLSELARVTEIIQEFENIKALYKQFSNYSFEIRNKFNLDRDRIY